jgi:hypothetical protein
MGMPNAVVVTTFRFLPVRQDPCAPDRAHKPLYLIRLIVPKQ